MNSDLSDPNLVTEWSWRDPKIEQRRKTNIPIDSITAPKAPRGSIQLRTGDDDLSEPQGRSRAPSNSFLTQEQINQLLAMRDSQHKDPHDNVGSHLNLAVAVTSALLQMHHRASRQSIFARKYMRKREIEEEGLKGILKRNKELRDSKSLDGDYKKPHQTISPLKHNAILEYAIPPKTLEAGVVRDDEYVIDWKGSLMDVPVKFYKTTVKKEVCTQDDLNEIFTEKFALNDRSEYFGRTLVIVSYVYMIFSAIVLVTTSGLYFTPSKTQMLVTLNSEQSMKSLYVLLLCGILSSFSSITIYVVLLQNYRRIIPYILHVMVLISILFLAVSCWTKKSLKLSSSRDYVSFFVASAMRDVDPNFLQDVWPDVDPHTFSSIQKTFFCCGIKSPNDWFNLDQFHTPAIDPSCCINTTIDGVPTKCTLHMEEWKKDPTDKMKFNRMKAWINQQPCEEILQKQNEYYNWDLQMYPMIFCVVHTCLLSIASYLLHTYIREVNTWDGEVRMNLYRQNHKNYLLYLLKLLRFKVKQVICTCCNYRVYPERPPRYILGETTHFEVWHTASGDIVNVVEVPLDQEKELQRQHQNELEEFMDVNIGMGESGGGSMTDRGYEKLYTNFKKAVPRKSFKKKDTREQLKALDWMDFDIGPYFSSEKGLLQSFLHEHEGEEEV